MTIAAILAWLQSPIGIGVVAGAAILFGPKVLSLLPESITAKLPAWLTDGKLDITQELSGLSVVKNAKLAKGELRNAGSYIGGRAWRAQVMAVVNKEDQAAAAEHFDALLVMIAKAQAAKEQPKPATET